MLGLDIGCVTYQASASEQVTEPPSASVSSSLMRIMRYLISRWMHHAVNVKQLNTMMRLCVRACVLSPFSRVRLFAPLWTRASQTPLSMGFSRQEYWNALPCPPPRDLPDPEIEHRSLTSSALAGEFFTTSKCHLESLWWDYKHHVKSLLKRWVEHMHPEGFGTWSCIWLIIIWEHREAPMDMGRHQWC